MGVNTDIMPILALYKGVPNSGPALLVRKIMDEHGIKLYLAPDPHYRKDPASEVRDK